MEAKDTVMPFMRIEEIDAKNAASNFTDALLDVAREQAKISFKVGIKEVVEWAERNDPNNLFWQSRCWKEQKEEWGL